MRQDGQTNHCQLPKGTERHAQNQNLVIKLKNTGDVSRTWRQAFLPLGQCRNRLLGGLALLQYCNITSYKMNAGSVYTLDIYALITDNQIQIGQSVNRNSDTLKPPAR